MLLPWATFQEKTLEKSLLYIYKGHTKFMGNNRFNVKLHELFLYCVRWKSYLSQNYT